MPKKPERHTWSFVARAAPPPLRARRVIWDVFETSPREMRRVPSRAGKSGAASAEQATARRAWRRAVGLCAVVSLLSSAVALFLSRDSPEGTVARLFDEVRRPSPETKDPPQRPSDAHFSPLAPSRRDVALRVSSSHVTRHMSHVCFISVYLLLVVFDEPYNTHACSRTK